MTIRRCLARSNLVMILIPVAIAAVLLLAGGGLAVLLLKRVYLPRLGLSMAALHETGEQLETAFAGAKAIAAIYGGTVILALLAAVAFRLQISIWQNTCSGIFRRRWTRSSPV